MFQNMFSKTPPGRSKHRLPEIFPPNLTQQSNERIDFPNGVCVPGMLTRIAALE